MSGRQKRVSPQSGQASGDRLSCGPVQLKIRVIPRAARTQWAGWRGEALVVRVQAPPIEGAANEALLKFLAAELRVRRGDLEIVAGEKAREKVIAVQGLAARELAARLPPTDPTTRSD